jgi:PST family polysaccharide transporter
VKTHSENNSESGGLGTDAVRATGWSLANTALAKFGTVGIGVVLARMLGPESFGTFAVATVALLAILAFNELGVSLAIVRWPGDPGGIIPTVSTLAVMSSVVLFGAGYFAAPGFAGAMGDPEATGVVRLMCLCILLNGLVAAPAAVMQRHFRQRERMFIDQVNIWLGAVLSVALAVGGLGAMSLAIGRVAGTAVAAVLFVRCAPRAVRFGWDQTLLRPLLRFGLPLAGASAIVFAVGYADQVVTGSLLGTTQLGLYVLAFNLASWPVALFSQPLRSVAPAVFARMQGDRAAMGRVFVSLSRVLALVAVPMCLLLAGAAEPIVSFVYGVDWAPAVVALRWLALFAALRILFELAYDYLVVLQRSRAILAVQAAWATVLVPTLAVGAWLFGIEGVAAAQLLVGTCVALPAYWFLLATSGVAMPAFWRGLVVPVSAGAVVGLWALGSAAVVATPLTACLLAGFPALLVVAALAYRDRAQITSLRVVRASEMATV